MAVESKRTRIWIQKHTVEGRRPLLDAWYRDHLAALVSDETEIDIHTLPAEAYASSLPEGMVRYGAIETFFSEYFACQAVAAERAGYDAFITLASQDPGLHSARSLVGIPVLGYGETSFHMAAMSGQRFAVVGFIEELEEILRENLARARLEHLCAGFEYVEGGAEVVEEGLTGRPERFVASFLAAARRAVARGAQLIIPGEGLPNEILWREGITELDGVPIVDSDGLVVTMAELSVRLIRAGVFGRSHAGYWLRRPDPAFMAHLQDVFWPAG